MALAVPMQTGATSSVLATSPPTANAGAALDTTALLRGGFDPMLSLNDANSIIGSPNRNGGGGGVGATSTPTVDAGTRSVSNGSTNSTNR